MAQQFSKKQKKSSRSLNSRKQELKARFQREITTQWLNDAAAIRSGKYNPPKKTNKTKERVFKRREDQY